MLAIGGITITDTRKETMLMSDGYLANGKTILCRAAPLIERPFTHGEIGVLMRRGQDDLLAIVNTVISQMKADGSPDQGCCHGTEGRERRRALGRGHPRHVFHVSRQATEPLSNKSQHQAGLPGVGAPIADNQVAFLLLRVENRRSDRHAGSLRATGNCQW